MSLLAEDIDREWWTAQTNLRARKIYEGTNYQWYPWKWNIIEFKLTGTNKGQISKRIRFPIDDSGNALYIGTENTKLLYEFIVSNSKITI